MNAERLSEDSKSSQFYQLVFNQSSLFILSVQTLELDLSQGRPST